MKEVEISIKGYIFYILKHWKSILAAMIIGALALNGLRIIKNMHALQNNSQIAVLEPELSDSEKAYVETVYNYVENLQQVIDSRNDSLLMRMDPQNVVKTELSYMIMVDEPEQMEGVELGFRNSLSGVEFREFVSENTGIPASDVAETVSLIDGRVRTNSSSAMLYFIVLSENNEYSAKVCSSIDEFIANCSKELSSKGLSHDLEKINEYSSWTADATLLNSRTLFLQEQQMRIKAIIEGEAALTGAQKNYYDWLKESGNPSENATVADDSTNTAASTFSTKYALVGIILGLFVMCGLYFVIYIFANKLDEEDDIESIFGTCFIGSVPGKEYGKLLYNLRKIGKKKKNYDESINLVNSKILMSANKDNYKIIGIVGTQIKDDSEKTAKDITEKLKQNNIDAVIIDNPLFNADAVSKLAGIEHAVLLEQTGFANRREIKDEIELLNNLEIHTEGMVTIG